MTPSLGVSATGTALSGTRPPCAPSAPNTPILSLREDGWHAQRGAHRSDRVPAGRARPEPPDCAAFRGPTRATGCCTSFRAARHRRGWRSWRPALAANDEPAGRVGQAAAHRRPPLAATGTAPPATAADHVVARVRTAVRQRPGPGRAALALRQPGRASAWVDTKRRQPDPPGPACPTSPPDRAAASPSRQWPTRPLWP